MTVAESWRPIPGYPGYEASGQGRIRSYRRSREPRILRGGATAFGHRQVCLRVDGRKVTALVHVLVMRAFVGPRPEGMVTRHLDGDPTNNHLGNLKYGTHSENLADEVRHGTHRMASRTHCPRGHEYAGDNLGISRGYRYCRACNKQKCKLKYRARLAAQMVAA